MSSALYQLSESLEGSVLTMISSNKSLSSAVGVGTVAILDINAALYVWTRNYLPFCDSNKSDQQKQRAVGLGHLITSIQAKPGIQAAMVYSNG